jgi:hypothetical protein
MELRPFLYLLRFSSIFWAWVSTTRVEWYLQHFWYGMAWPYHSTDMEWHWLMWNGIRLMWSGIRLMWNGIRGESDVYLRNDLASCSCADFQTCEIVWSAIGTWSFLETLWAIADPSDWRMIPWSMVSSRHKNAKCMDSDSVFNSSWFLSQNRKL